MGSRQGRLSAQFHVDPADKLFYWDGETVSGTVVLQATKQVSVTSIDLQLVGELFYQRREHRGPGRGPHMVVIDENLPFFVGQLDLVSSPVNNYSNQLSTELNSGVYEWPFSFRLADDLPPSLEMAGEEKPPYIQYLLKLSCARPGKISRTLIASFRIKVTPRVGLPRQIHPIKIDDENRKDVYVHVKLLRNYLLVGERAIPMELHIRNPNQSSIKEVVIILKQRRQLGVAGTHETVLYTTNLPDVFDFQGESLNKTYALPILCSPTKLVPSYVYKASSDIQSPWSIDYAFEITFNIGGLITNMFFKLPISVVNHKSKL